MRPFTIATIIFLNLLFCMRSALAQTTQATDRSTPAAAYDALVDAIDRGDGIAITDAHAFAFDLSAEQKRVFGDYEIASARLCWALQEKLDAPKTTELLWGVVDASALPAHVKGASLSWRPLSITPAATRFGIKERGGFKIALGGERTLAFVKTADGWKRDMTATSATLLDYSMQTAGMTIPRLQKVLGELRSGKISSEADIRQALRVTPTSMPNAQAMDRTTPQGAMALLHKAFAADDLEAALDGFDYPDPLAREFKRAYLDQQIALHQLDISVAAKFGPVRASSMPPAVDPFTIYDPKDGWEIDGDVAQGIFDGRAMGLERMIRKDGVWRIGMMPMPSEMPKPTTQGVTRRIDEIKKMTARYRLTLAHLNDYHTIGAVLIATDPFYAERSDRNREIEHLQKQIAQYKAGLAQQPVTEPKKDFEAHSGFLLYAIYLTTISHDAAAAAQYFMCKGDDGSYVLAREQRVVAASALDDAAMREIRDWNSAPSRYADNPFDHTNIVWEVNGDVVSGTSGYPVENDWIPPVRKINGEWKIDVTDEVRGEPRAAAAVEKRNAQQLDAIRARVERGEFESSDQLIAALRDAKIRILVPAAN